MYPMSQRVARFDHGLDERVLLYPNRFEANSLPPNLPQRLIQPHARGGGEVQAAFAGDLGDAEATVGGAGGPGGGEAVRFAAEDQAVAVFEVGVPVGAFGFAGEEP